MVVCERFMLEDKLRKHFVDTTAMITESNPIFAISEIASGLSIENSINARLFAAGIGYFGFAKVYSSGRDFWKKSFGVSEVTSEIKQVVCDLGYSVTFNLFFSPIMYYVAGERDFETIALATGASMGLSLFNGAPVGYAIDVSRDLFGIKECKRKSYPKKIKELSLNSKRKIAIGLIVGSIGITSLVYQVSDLFNDSVIEANNN